MNVIFFYKSKAFRFDIICMMACGNQFWEQHGATPSSPEGDSFPTVSSPSEHHFEISEEELSVELQNAFKWAGCDWQETTLSRVNTANSYNVV